MQKRASGSLMVAQATHGLGPGGGAGATAATTRPRGRAGAGGQVTLDRLAVAGGIELTQQADRPLLEPLAHLFVVGRAGLAHGVVELELP